MRTSIRARVAIGSAVMAVAGFGAVGQLSASPESAPPSTPPGSEPGADTAVEGSLATPAPEPVGSAPALDPESEALVENIVASAEAAGFPLDGDCVAGLVAQLPPEDVPVLAEQIAAGAPASVPDPVAGTLVVETVPVDTSGAGDPGATEPVDTAVVDTAIVESVPMEPEMPTSPAIEELGSQIIMCAAGDADPALVADALAVIETDADAPAFDLLCVESVLSTFSDETLQLIIDEGEVVPTETAADATVSVETVTGDTSVAGTEAAGTEPAGSDLVITLPEISMPDISIPEISIPDEEAFGEAMLLLACSPEFIDEATAVDSGEGPPAPDTATVGTIPSASEPTETTVS